MSLPHCSEDSTRCTAEVAKKVEDDDMSPLFYYTRLSHSFCAVAERIFRSHPSVKDIEDMIVNEKIPEVTKSKKCNYCEMQKLC